MANTLPFGSPAYVLYLFIFAASAVGCLVGVRQARRVSLPGVRRGLTSLLVASGLWSLCHVGMLLAPGLGLKAALYEAGLIVGFGTVWAWLWLCSAYSGRALHRRRSVQWAALIVFAGVTATKLTNSWHGLYFAADVGTVPFRHLAVNHHAVYWSTAALSYVLAALGFFMLAEPLRRLQVGVKKLAGLFALTALPLGANAIGYLGPYLLDVNHEPVGVAAFALGALALGDVQLEGSSRAGQEEQPTLVLSGDGRIQNYNQAGARLFPALREETAAGSLLEETLPRLSGALGNPASNGQPPVEQSAMENSSAENSSVENFSAEEKSGEATSVLKVAADGGRARYVRPVESPFRGGAGRLVILQDVTEQELRRREQEARLHAVSTSMPGATFEFRVGPGGARSVEFISEEAESFLGLSPGLDRFYERFLRRIPEGHRDGFVRAVEEAARSRSRWRHEFPLKRADGEQVWLLGSAEPEEGGEGGVLFRGLLLEITRRKEEQRRRQQVICRVTDGIIEVDSAWRFTLLNDQAERLCDTTEEEVLGKSFWQVFEEAEGTRFEEVYRGAMQSREPARLREYYSGLGEWFDVQVYPNEDGGLAFYFEEITDWKEQEEALKRQEKQLRSITENVSEGIYRSTPGAGIVYANSAFVDMFGYESLDALRAADPAELYDDAAEREALYRQEARQGGLDGAEVRFQRKDGSVFYGLLSTQHVEGPDGATAYYDGAIADITERKRRKRQLERQNDLFQRAQQIASVGAWEYDVAAGELTWTDQVYRIHGRKAVEGQGPSVDEAVESYHPEDRPTIRDAFARAVEEGEPYDLQVRLCTDGGEERWVRTRGEAQVERGEVVRVRGTMQDITAQKRREQALKAAKDEAEKAEQEAEEARRMQSVFLANMSHEIRTPLTTIIGFAEALGTEAAGLELPEDCPFPKYARLIEKGGTRLLETLDGVLNLSQLEAEQMRLASEPVGLGKEACRAAEELRPEAEEKQIDLEVQCECAQNGDASAEDVWAVADEGGVQIVLRNLLSNAIKYTGEGGTVWVRSYQEESRAVLEVEDTGIGMEPSMVDRLFEPFRQESEGLGREYEGSGVGLAVTKRAVEKMDGSVGAETEKGEGSRFTVRLPLAE